MNFSLKARVLCGAALSALTIGGHAYAQDDAANESVESIAEETEEEARQEKIVVTGSLIARSNFTSASPIQIITAEEATLEGLIDTAALLQGSSIASGSTQLNNTFQNFVTNGGVGTRTLDLRGCGDVRTLILVNGKRPGPSGTRGAVSAFDLNNIPQSIVQRIEILKDGASTIYGSDAVCGVANIITRDTIDSPELTFSGTLPFESGGEEFRINGAFGLEFGDNVDLTFSAEYRLSNELNVGDRDYLNCERDRVTDPSTGAVLDRINASVTAGSGRGNCSNLYFNTVVDAFSFGSRLVPNPGGADAGSAVQGLFIPGYRPRANGVNSAGQLFYEDVLDAPFLDERDFFPENENLALFGTANVVLGQLDWDTQMLYNKRTTTVEGFRQFFPYVGSNDINNFGPGAGGAFGLNYLGDPGYVNSAGGLALPVMPYPTFDEISVEYVLLSSSLGGGFGDFLPDWSWNLSATYSRGEGDYSGSEILISKSGDWGLDGVADYTGDGIPDLVAPPTIDYFDPAILSGAAMDQLVAAVGGYQTGNTVYDQTTLTGVAAGELFDLPAGPVSVGLGFEYREFSVDDQPGVLTQSGDVWGSSTAGPTKGTNSVSEVFAEIDVPIVKGMTLAEDLTLSASARAFDYDLGGEDEIYKLGLNWQINPTLRVRSAYGTSYRAPALFELFLEEQTGFVGQFGIDPCINYDDPAQNTPQIIKQNCAADGIPGNYNGAASSALVVSSGGGELLEPETGDVFTAGIIFTPTFMDLNIAVDYYEIEINDQIADLSAGTVVGACYASQNYPNEYCNLFTRSPASSTEAFALDVINTPILNIDSQQQRGIDLTVRYEKEIDYGVLSLNMNVNWSLERITELFGSDFVSGVDNNDFNGTIGFPSMTGEATLRFERNDWTYSWFTDFVGRQDSNRYSDLDFNEPQSYFGLDALYDTNTEAVFYHGISAQWEGDTWTLTGGISNLFDELPPQVSTGTGLISFSAGNTPLSATAYDMLGRSAFMTISKKF